MAESIFRFKEFSCSHSRSSMKIGVDGVLIGAWAEITGNQILDVGTGCGLIALMCAQRNSEAKILAIDIDEASCKEAAANFLSSPWSKRLKVKHEDFNSFKFDRFNLIISNPPFFKSGIEHPDTTRLKARHQDLLSPALIVDKAYGMLSDSGSMALVVPFDQFEELVVRAKECGYRKSRICIVSGHANASPKRALLQFYKSGDANDSISEKLILEEAPNHPTSAYRELCRNFYLYF